MNVFRKSTPFQEIESAFKIASGNRFGFQERFQKPTQFMNDFMKPTRFHECFQEIHSVQEIESASVAVCKFPLPF